MNFMFACGGTAGHINPALAVADELRRIMPDAKMLFVGSGRDLENRLIPAAGYELTNIKMSGLMRGFSPSMIVHNLNTVKNLAVAGGKAAKLIESEKVFVNWQEVKSASKLVTEDDNITLRGTGRAKIESINGTTSKDNISVTVTILGK